MCGEHAACRSVCFRLEKIKAGTLPKLKPRRHLAPQPSVVLKERLERALVPEVGGNEPVGSVDVPHA